MGDYESVQLGRLQRSSVWITGIALVHSFGVAITMGALSGGPEGMFFLFFLPIMLAVKVVISVWLCVHTVAALAEVFKGEQNSRWFFILHSFAAAAVLTVLYRATIAGVGFLPQTYFAILVLAPAFIITRVLAPRW